MMMIKMIIIISITTVMLVMMMVMITSCGFCFRYSATSSSLGKDCAEICLFDILVGEENQVEMAYLGFSCWEFANGNAAAVLGI